jgi:hypothetical protein
MSFQSEMSQDRDATTPIPSDTTASSTPANAFTTLMGRGPNSVIQPIQHLRDRCNRPTPSYNFNYNPNESQRDDLPGGYSPYIRGEPLFDDRAIVLAQLPKHHTVAGASKRGRTAWVWSVGYALINNSKHSKPLMWACKHCKLAFDLTNALIDSADLTLLIGHHDPVFARNKVWIYNANTLINAENHMRDTHYLDQGGDIWRKPAVNTPAQASGFVDGNYERVIPFRQQEFVNTFLEWVVCDGIKHRKAASIRLRRCFKIANHQAVDALPKSHITVASWIDRLFEDFEPEIIEEVRTARSRIHVSFDGWGSKHEKLSVVGIVIHMVNAKGDNVTRLIGLPELPGHGKSGVGKYAFYGSADIFSF